MEAEQGQEDYSVPNSLFMVSAFLAMEPSETVLSFARDFGGGSVTQSVQSFIWHHCIKTADLKLKGLYVKRFIKKLILEIESSGDVAMDELYECYSSSLISLGDGIASKGRVSKTITFLFPDDCPGAKSQKLSVQLHSSVNMLEGDTGCCIWPSSLFLSEFILSFPEIFANKRCLELGSGVGLVGVCLSYVKASKVILTDGDLSTLANMKANMELNNLSIGTHEEDNLVDQNTAAHCLYLPWESASEDDLHRLAPDIILGADIIYDPSCLPHLVRVLALLLNRKISSAEVSADYEEAPLRKPCAYVTSVIRNVDTFNRFLGLAREAHLSVVDLTREVEVLSFLPYMKSYERSSIRIFEVCS